ncbi:MAG: inositol monophosphatase [Cyanobium sp. CACIAM 14]|nr:MAG: inositol monophosphatase [Cyanobium sp. CACIAM 14]
MSSLCEQARAGAGLDQAELERLLGVAREAAVAGGRQLRSHFGRLEQVRQKGAAGNLVTEADLAAEAAVLAVLEQRTPGLAVLAEESGRREGNGELQWCVDPLDGTTNYAHGFPVFATSVGLCWRGLPLLGALELPVLEEHYWAAPGQGAWCNGRRLQVTACDRLDDALLATGFSYDRTERRDNNYAEFAWFTHRTHGVRRAGAAAVDLAFVAAGRVDGYWERGLAPWDLAAGVVLVEEAGGQVCAYDGGSLDLSAGRVIACGSGLRQPLIEGLARCRPLRGASYGAPELDDDGCGADAP